MPRIVSSPRASGDAVSEPGLVPCNAMTGTGPGRGVVTPRYVPVRMHANGLAAEPKAGTEPRHYGKAVTLTPGPSPAKKKAR